MTRHDEPATRRQTRPPVATTGGRVAVVVSSVVQVLLIVLGASYIAESDEARGVVLLLLWCLLCTGYGVTVAIILTVRARLGPFSSPPPPLATRWIARVVSFASTVLASLVGLYAALQHLFLSPDDELRIFVQIVGVWAMLLSWGLLHWGFAQRYMQVFYATDPHPLRFPQTPFPGLVDFVYFSFTTAVSFAVSDVETQTARVRWLVVSHSVLGFFFNLLILALALNAITGAGS